MRDARGVATRLAYDIPQRVAFNLDSFRRFAVRGWGIAQRPRPVILLK